MYARAILVGFLLVLAAPAGAQDRRAEAREAFERGMASAGQEQWAQALESFERAYQLAPRPELLMNIATAAVNAGRYVQGAESYRRFLAALPRSRHARAARRGLAAAESRIARLSIGIEGAPRDQARLDGAPISARDEAILVDPGRHVVEVRDVRREVEVAAGQTLRVELAVIEPPETEPEPAPEPEPVTPPPSVPDPVIPEPPVRYTSSSGSGLSPLAIAGLVTAGVGLATFGVAGGIAFAEHQRVRDACGAEGLCGAGAGDSILALSITADVGLGVAATGAVLFVIGLLVGEDSPPAGGSF